MIINNYYRGATDKVSGFAYDTEAKTYKEFSIQGKDWTREAVGVDEFGRKRSCIMTKEGFRLAGDIACSFQTKWDMEIRLDDIKELGFTEDTAMVLDFGIFKI